MIISRAINALSTPPHLECPISKKIYKEPVLACMTSIILIVARLRFKTADGYTYDQEPLIQHLKTSLVSPSTGKLFPNTTMTPHIKMKSMVERHVKRASKDCILISKDIFIKKGNTVSGDCLSLMERLLYLVGKTFYTNKEWMDHTLAVCQSFIKESEKESDRTSALSMESRALKFQYSIFKESGDHENFKNIRIRLINVSIKLNDVGYLETILSTDTEYNDIHCWKILPRIQAMLGKKEEAYHSLLKYASLCLESGDIVSYEKSSKLAKELDPFDKYSVGTEETGHNVKKEELLRSLYSDSNNVNNLKTLLDYLEQEGDILNTVKLSVFMISHYMTSNNRTEDVASLQNHVFRLLEKYLNRSVSQISLLGSEVKLLREEKNISLGLSNEVHNISHSITTSSKHSEIIKEFCQYIEQCVKEGYHLPGYEPNNSFLDQSSNETSQLEIKSTQQSSLENLDMPSNENDNSQTLSIENSSLASNIQPEYNKDTPNSLFVDFDSIQELLDIKN